MWCGEITELGDIFVVEIKYPNGIRIYDNLLCS